ncbi:unnamed protein product, partial [Ectocarpus fasciculatus]
MLLLWGRLLGRPVAAAIVEVDGGVDMYVLLRRCLVVAFSSPWVEMIGIALGVSTGWYFRRRDVITKRQTQQQQQRQQQQRQLVVGWSEQAVTAAASADGALVEREVGRGWDGGGVGE